MIGLGMGIGIGFGRGGTAVERLPAPTNPTAEDNGDGTFAYSFDPVVVQYAVPFTASDLHYNGRDGTESPRHSVFSVLKLTTDASSLTVTAISDVFDYGPTYARIGVRVDGVFQSPLALAAADTPEDFTVTLGAAGTVRTVELIAGLQSNPASTTFGTYFTAVTANGGSSQAIVAPSTAGRLLVYGDSISVGGNADAPQSEAWTVLLRYNYGREVMVEGWGYRALGYDVAAGGALVTAKSQAFAERIASYDPEVFWMAIGTNDYGLNYWFEEADFATAYADFLDRLHALLPSLVIYCQTPLVRSSEVANGFGDTLPEFRAEIATVCASRAWVTLVDGTAILTTGDLADGVHPTTAGHAAYAAYVDGVLP